MGHLDNDNIMPDIDVVLPLLVTDELTNSFSKLGKAGPPKMVSVEKVVVVLCEHQAITPMETDQTTEASKDTKDVVTNLQVEKDDHDRNIDISVLTDL